MLKKKTFIQCLRHHGRTVFLLLAVACIVCFAQTANASETVVSGKLNAQGIQIKTGGYYYTEHYGEGFYVSSTEGEKGILALPKTLSGMSFQADVFISGKYLYYSYSKGKNHKIYRMNPDGSGKKLLVSFQKKGSCGGHIDFVYKDKYLLYSCTGEGSDVYNCSVSLKKKKVKFLKGYNVKFMSPKTNLSIKDSYHYKNYYVAGVQAGDFYYDSAWVYNVKKQTFQCISKKAWDIALAGKYVYYIENSGHNSCKLKRCSVNGRKKKTLCGIKGQYISFHEVTGSYCIYVKSNVYYKYDFKTKRTKKVNV